MEFTPMWHFHFSQSAWVLSEKLRCKEGSVWYGASYEKTTHWTECISPSRSFRTHFTLVGLSLLWRNVHASLLFQGIFDCTFWIHILKSRKALDLDVGIVSLGAFGTDTSLGSCVGVKPGLWFISHPIMWLHFWDLGSYIFFHRKSQYLRSLSLLSKCILIWKRFDICARKQDMFSI